MNISLLDESVQLRRYPPVRCCFCCLRALRKGFLRLGVRRSWWPKSIISSRGLLTRAFRTSPRASPSSSSLLRYHLHRNDLEQELQYAFQKKPEPTLQASGACCYGADTVVVKIGIVGDDQTGKTSLMENYIGVDDSLGSFGIRSMDKVFHTQASRIAMTIWDLGDYRQAMAPIVCEDAAAIIILFDLTRRSTLHSVKQWFMRARECNQVALPVLVGTKFDQFIKMPESVRLLITKQARLYAQAMGAPLLFTSVPYNINVNKVFKVLLAKLFDLPCNISRNINPGEPVIEY